MSRSSLKFALALSLLLNAGVLGAVAYQAVKYGGLPPLIDTTREVHAADFLRLSPEQRERWCTLEADFMVAFKADARAIAEHRERLIREIFSETPAVETIEAERQTITGLQTEQQRRVIAQLLREREILDRRQRHALADFLLRQAADFSPVERVHGQ